MNMRNDWSIEEESFTDIFYNKEETVQNVKDNFDMRRYYTAEGYDIEINGIVERCLVQTSSNPLRELNDFRKIHCPITSDIRRGYYVKYEGSVWIIDTNVANIDNAYLSTRMTRCQYILRWQNKFGDIVERYAYSSDQTKYSNGEYNNGTLTIGDNQYGLILPIDNETKQLKRGMRFAFDFDDADTPDVYKLSNRKIKLNDETHDNRGGTIQMSFSIEFFNKDTDKRVKLPDGKEVWICDYHSSTVPPDINDPDFPNETANLSAEILGNRNLKIGYPRTYSVKFMNSNGDDVTVSNFDWNIVSNFQIKQTLKLNTIGLSILDDSLIGESFLLQIIINGNVISEAKIVITEGM